MIRTVLEDSGVDPQRFALEWVSSAEAPRFAKLVTQFTETIGYLGPHVPLVDNNVKEQVN